MCADWTPPSRRGWKGIENKVGVVDCPEANDDRPTEEGDRAQLAEMRREIDALIGDAAGASIEDCRYMALGDKALRRPLGVHSLLCLVHRFDGTSRAGDSV